MCTSVSGSDRFGILLGGHWLKLLPYPAELAGKRSRVMAQQRVRYLRLRLGCNSGLWWLGRVDNIPVVHLASRAGSRGKGSLPRDSPILLISYYLGVNGIRCHVERANRNVVVTIFGADPSTLQRGLKAGLGAGLSGMDGSHRSSLSRHAVSSWAGCGDDVSP